MTDTTIDTTDVDTTDPNPRTIDELISWLKTYSQSQDDDERVTITGYGHLYVIVINGFHDCGTAEQDPRDNLLFELRRLSTNNIEESKVTIPHYLFQSLTQTLKEMGWTE